MKPTLRHFLIACTAIAAMAACQTEGTTQGDGDQPTDVASDSNEIEDSATDDAQPEDGEATDSDPDDSGPDDAGDPPECGAAFSILPADPGTGSLLTVSYTDPEPLTFVGLDFSGPGRVDMGQLEIIENASDYTWSWPVTVDTPGRYTVTFTYDQNPQKTGASCEFDVDDTGPPPTIDPGDDAGTCLCGEGDCETCPVEGSCFDDPSPYSPSGSGTWQCLDNAGCSGDNCRIWCPFEPCPRPDGEGCVNNTETCYVPPGITDYEEACRTCCESAPRNAEWNAEDNYCMEPRPL